MSECQRLASLGLPNDTGRRPSMLHVVNRGQYSDDCADIARSTSCYLLALDTMWNALNKKDESEYTVLHRLATAVDASFKKNDDDKDTDKGTYSLSVNDTDQMEFLKLQLAVNIS